VVGGEYVLITPSSFARAGVATATPAGDGISAVDVVFDVDGAAAFSKAATEVAVKGDGARLVVRVDDRVLSAVRVPSSISVTTMRIAVPADLDPADVARQINAG
jgi:hypothetical protein